MCDQQSLKSACAYAQSDQSLCWSLEYFLIVKLLTENHLEFLNLTGGCRGSSESAHVKMAHCWKSHATAHILNLYLPKLAVDVEIVDVVKLEIAAEIHNAEIEDLT